MNNEHLICSIVNEMINMTAYGGLHKEKQEWLYEYIIQHYQNIPPEFLAKHCKNMMWNVKRLYQEHKNQAKKR